MKERNRPNVFWPAAMIALPVFSTIAKYEFSGERLPETGAFILAPNHYSEIDPVVLGVAVWRLGRIPRFMAKASLFRVPVLGWWMKRAKHIPVSRERGGNAQTVSAAKDLVDAGGGVIVYPEGSLTRDPDLWPMRGKSGVVRLALQQGMPIIPVAQWGAQHIMAPYGKKLDLKPGKRIQVAIGKPMTLDEYRGKPMTGELLEHATDELMGKITELLEGIRSEKAPAERWDPKDHGQSETGRL